MRNATKKAMKMKNSALAMQNAVRLITLKPKTPAIRPWPRKVTAHTNMIDPSLYPRCSALSCNERALLKGTTHYAQRLHCHSKAFELMTLGGTRALFHGHCLFHW